MSDIPQTFNSRQQRGTLAEHLERQRERLFVGREAELQRFGQILDGRSTTRLLVISGAGGIGKSELAGQLQALALRRGAPLACIDAQQLQELSPNALQSVIAESTAPLDPRACLNLLCIDNVERMAAMQDWLRRRLPTLLPAATLVVLVGRWQPPVHWRADPALACTMEHWPLAPLSRDQMEAYLQQRELAAAQRAAVCEFAQGHPLVMALAANHLRRTGESSFRPEQSGELIQYLVDWLFSNVDHSSYREGLEVAASLQFVNEPVLQAVLPDADVKQLYRWLAEEPYMAHGQWGLTMHELVRIVIVENLRRRNIPRHHRLIRRAIDYYFADLEALEPEYLRHALGEVGFALRWEPYMRQYYDFSAPQTHYLDRARSDEKHRLADIVEVEEGADARKHFLYWWDKTFMPPEVVRDTKGKAVGVVLFLVFDETDLKVEHSDPVVKHYTQFLEDYVPLGGNDRALLLRFGMISGSYQKTSPAFTQVAMKTNNLIFSPGLVHIGAVCDRLKGWDSSAYYASFQALPGSRLSTERRQLELRGFDLRAEPPLVWVRNVVDRTLGTVGEDKDSRATATFNRYEFFDATLEAMRHFNDYQALSNNPLLRSHLMQQFVKNRPPGVEDLRRLIAQAVRSLNKTHPHKHLTSIIEQSYFKDEGKQITAANALNISESTFRRRLRKAEREVVERLWAREVQHY